MPTPDSQPLTSAPALGEGGFEPYLRAIRRHPLIVGLVALGAVAGAGAWMLLRAHRYQAVSQVLVTPAPFDDGTYTGLPIIRDISADPTRAIQTAAQILDSPAAAATTAQTLGGGWTKGQVRAAVTVTPIGGTNVLAVQASAGQASFAARIADAFVTAALEQRRQALRGDATQLIAQLKTGRRPPPAAQLDALLAVAQGFDPSFSLLHAAAPPGARTGPAAWRTLSIVLFAGLVLGVAVALLADGALRRFSGEAEVVELGVRRLPFRKDAPVK